MDHIAQRRKQVTAEIEALTRQVDGMDNKIRAYLADRKNRPHPQHLDLIEKIQGYRLDPHISNKQLRTMLDNLQWKVYYIKRAWKQLWENAEAQRRKEASNTLPISENSEPAYSSLGAAPTPQYSVDTLWEIQQEKLRAYGPMNSTETKNDFKKRILTEYRKLYQEKKPNQEIVLTFDKTSKHCKLDVK